MKNACGSAFEFSRFHAAHFPFVAVFSMRPIYEVVTDNIKGLQYCSKRWLDICSVWSKCGASDIQKVRKLFGRTGRVQGWNSYEAGSKCQVFWNKVHLQNTHPCDKLCGMLFQYCGSSVAMKRTEKIYILLRKSAVHQRKHFLNICVL